MTFDQPRALPADQPPVIDTSSPDAGLSFWQKEPALIIGAVTSLLALAASFGVNISDEKRGAIIGGVTAVLALAASFAARSQVKPKARADAQILQARKDTAGTYQVELDQAKGQLATHAGRAASAEGTLAMLTAIHAAGPVSGPAPDAGLHPMLSDPELPEVSQP